jgi:hypothetical protein
MQLMDSTFVSEGRRAVNVTKIYNTGSVEGMFGGTAPKKSRPGTSFPEQPASPGARLNHITINVDPIIGVQGLKLLWDNVGDIVGSFVGGTTHHLSLAPDEFVDRVMIHFGDSGGGRCEDQDAIDNLMFHTNKGNQVGGERVQMDVQVWHYCLAAVCLHSQGVAAYAWGRGAVLFLVGTGPPLMGRPAATPGLIHTKTGPASGRRPKEQGWLHLGPMAGGQSVPEL